MSGVTIAPVSAFIVSAVTTVIASIVLAVTEKRETERAIASAAPVMEEVIKIIGHKISTFFI